MRSSLASAAWAVEDRVVWGAADLFRGLVDVVKWPFERIAWAVEHWLVWPIQEETALWSRPVRGAVLAGVIVLAGAGVAAGVIVSNPSTAGGNDVAEPVAAATGTSAVPRLIDSTPSRKTAKTAIAAGGPVLHGSTPDFVPESGGGVPKADAATGSGASEAGAKAGAATGSAVDDAGASAGHADSGTDVVGPGAIKVARSFAAAFVLYETGRDNAKVRAAFHRTATPDLSKALLKRPPRLPANVKVPKAKVLNIVAGPKHGETYTLSVSLLRVGVTSELRLDMQQTAAKGRSRNSTGESRSGSDRSGGAGSQWLVTDVLG